MAASRTLSVQITGDAKSFQRAMGTASKQTGQLEGKIKKFSGVTANAFKLAGAAAAGALVVGLKSSVDAAIEAEKSQARLDAQLKAMGTSYRDHGKEIDAVIQKTSQLAGLDDEDLQDAFTAVVRATGNVNVAMEDMAVVADLARAKNMDVAKAGELVAKIHAGSVGPLKRMGIEFTKTTANVDRLKETNKKFTPEQLKAAKAADATSNSQRALGLLQKKVAGQAEAYGKTSAGAQDRFKVAVENLQEKLGGALLPVLGKVADKASKFVDEMTKGKGAGGRFADTMKRVADDVKRVLDPVVGVAKWLAKHPRLLAVAGGAWVAYKTAAILQIGIVKAASLGLFGGPMRAKLAGNAAKTGTTVGRGFAAKAGLAAAAGIAGWEIGKWLRAKIPAVKSAGDAIGKQLGEAIFGGSDLQDKVDAAIDLRNKLLADANANPPSPGHPRGNPGKPAVPKSKPKKKATPKVINTARAGTASVSARSSSMAGIVARASGGSVSGDTAGLNGDFLNRLRAMAAGTGRAISVQDGFRTAADQQQRINDHGVWSQSNPTGAAPVGSSMHERGLAADITPGREVFGGVCARYGLAFPIGAEPWHCQAAGAATGGSTTGSTAVTTTKKAPPKVTAYEKLTNQLEHIDLLGSSGKIGSQAVTKRSAAAIRKALKGKGIRGNDRLRALTTLRELPKPPRPLPQKTQKQAAAATWTAENLDALLQAALDQIDLNVAAGRLTEEEGRARKVQILRGALPHLSGNQVLDAEAGIRSLTAPPDAGTGEDPNQPLIDAQNAAAAAAEDAAAAAREQAAALAENTAEIKRQTDFATTAVATEAGAMSRWVTEVISKQMGYGISGRALTPSYGVARRS